MSKNTKRVRLDITQADIDTAANRHDCWSCPVAQALHRMGFPDVTVGPSTIAFGLREYMMPDRLYSWILHYDFDRAAQPATFYIQVPVEG